MRVVDEKDLAEAEMLRHAELVARARSGNIMAQVALTKPDYEFAWHNRLIAKYVTKFVRKEIDRLMIFVPPQHGKSELVSRQLPALIHGMYPNDKVLAASYNATLASDMCVDVQRIMDLPEYAEIFPNSKIVPEGTSMRFKRTNDTHELIPILSQAGSIKFRPRGTYRAAGIDGSFTGKPGDWLLIDDPYKNRGSADSKAVRDQIRKNYSSTLKTRLKGRGQILIMHTRWHPDDLAANLQALAKSDPNADKWVILKLPAILEDESQRAIGDHRAIGDALWPDRFPLPVLLSHKAESSRDFQALYQQEPTSEQGSIIKREWIKFYKQAPSRLQQQIQSWDLSFKDTKNSDKVAGYVLGQFGADIYVQDQVYDQMGFTQTCNAIRMLSSKWPKAHGKLIEDKANGPAVIDALKREVPGIIAVNPEGSKEARVHSVSPSFEAGNIWLPDPSIAPWVNDLVEELVSFPLVVNDDRTDALCQGIARLRKSSVTQLDRLNQM